MKQIEVAKKIGVSTQVWNNWMYRSTIPHYDKIEELAKILEVSPASLVVENIVEPFPTYKNGHQSSATGTIPFFDADNISILELLQGTKNISEANDFAYIPGMSADLIIPYFGKEMTPHLTNGDLIVLREIRDRSFFNFGNLYLITTTEQVIPRYIQASNKKGYIKLSTGKMEDNNIEISLKLIKSIKTL